ncbi:MAG: ACP phosphodiesterase [Prevotellaceae bacterium]|jgi:acyl carrier protein phosphodiesterase|nr:ACP phosphodiesterase [Prevotellaceae bacterium]
MNYLAHIFLSSSPPGQVGNFIGDFVKGQQMAGYPPDVQEGIRHHRAIDRFTDTHPVVQQTKVLLREPFGRYAGIILDMYFDHLLAVHFDDYSPVRLPVFARRFYWTLWQHRRILPPAVKGIMWHFILSNRLCRYATLAGLQGSLDIMVHYKNIPIDTALAIAFLQIHYVRLEADFAAFFMEVVETEVKGLIEQERE